MIKKLFFFGIIMISVFVLLANQRKKNIENLPLLNTKWILEEIHEVPITHTSDTAFIIFDESYKISGNFGCNLFFGNFSFGKKRMKIDFLGSTRRLCVNMSLEEQFSLALRDDISHYYIEKNKLYLHNKDRVILKFEANSSL